MQAVHFILYVRDPQRSRAFYESVLQRAPVLDVPGMTEFSMGSSGPVLGLMPEAGIARLLGPEVIGSEGPSGPPGEGQPMPARRLGARCELYLVVDDARECHARALVAGARELSPVLLRDWGHLVGYLLDPDGHVLAFAQAAEG